MWQIKKHKNKLFKILETISCFDIIAKAIFALFSFGGHLLFWLWHLSKR